ncbi:hypothetical protein KQI48_09985 [Cellulomonas hominis]|uniref:hypothetical protein n=1 Tax=Cellulomonas hominis TaxID=156981 RepID=UPI001C0FA876|nr:hypothetical protein [Cellulomonas hominis]MBU5422993.1 hypothetical protein [Cellulomonas hominis]
MSRHLAPARAATAPRFPVRRAGLAALVAAVALVAGMLAGSAVTSAAFTDAARLGLGAGGVGSADPFDVVLVDAAGTARQAAPGTPLAVDLPDRDLLVPGRTVETTLRIANNHASIAAALSATVAAAPVAGTPDITPHLRVTVFGPDGGALLDGATPGTPADLGVLTARGGAAVADGAAWSEGAAGSWTTVTVRVHLLDVPATEALNGGLARLTVRLDAISTEETA